MDYMAFLLEIEDGASRKNSPRISLPKPPKTPEPQHGDAFAELQPEKPQPDPLYISVWRGPGDEIGARMEVAFNEQFSGEEKREYLAALELLESEKTRSEPQNTASNSNANEVSE